MVRLCIYGILLAALLAAACTASGCNAGVGGARRQFSNTLELPARAVQGANRIPVSLPTVHQALSRLPGEPQIRAALQGAQEDYHNAFR